MASRINLTVFAKFFKSGSTGGILLLFCVVISLIIANSSFGDNFQALLDREIGFKNTELRYPLLLWINDGLMAIFFLLVGLEIKRELIEGELSTPKRAFLPVFAAFGGAILPALIFFVLNKDSVTISGWGIPMATDIAFALGVLSLLGKRVPVSLKIFLAALAIVDDLIAILIIAVFYSANVHADYLLYAGLVFIGMMVLNKLKVKNLVFYLIPGLILWYLIHHSGIHATIAGVLTAITIPTTRGSKESSLEKLEHFLANPVNFIIMPLFALANTNIRFESGMLEGLGSNLGLGILLGLFLGKPIGITLMSWIIVKLGWGTLPNKANWKHIIGIGLLGGIGFTMSIFIALLSYTDESLSTESKFAILIASTISGICGYILLKNLNKKKKEPRVEEGQT
jgi:NhaA family Na+:H+ antiporter